MSCAYWAPKSTTRTVSNWSSTGVTEGAASVPHADVLGPLQLLAFGLQGGGDHDLGLLELLHRLVATRRHRGAQGAEEVEAPVVLVGGTDEDLLERAPLLDLHPRASRQRGMERGHAPVVAPAGSL